MKMVEFPPKSRQCLKGLPFTPLYLLFLLRSFKKKRKRCRDGLKSQIFCKNGQIYKYEFKKPSG